MSFLKKSMTSSRDLKDEGSRLGAVAEGLVASSGPSWNLAMRVGCTRKGSMSPSWLLRTSSSLGRASFLDCSSLAVVRKLMALEAILRKVGMVVL